MAWMAWMAYGLNGIVPVITSELLAYGSNSIVHSHFMSFHVWNVNRRSTRGVARDGRVDNSVQHLRF